MINAEKKIGSITLKLVDCSDDTYQIQFVYIVHSITSGAGNFKH